MSSEIQVPVRVRFAPSPTGYLHVGGARTAIYNELLVQSLGGVNILRIEDTDRERSDEAMTRQIIEALDWLGVQVDEGPFLQSDRVDRHRAEAFRLLAEEKAYHCFRTPEELDARRKEILGRGESYRYKTAFDIPAREEAERRMEAGEPYAVRLKVPDEEIVVHDLVRGDVPFPAEAQDDFIILRSDGTPTYHLSVCCDDVDMGVTHVIRGEDHLSNTPKHIALFRALGDAMPAFAHLPLILGTDKKRLSKRTGATSVEEFREQGILPQALYNYLALLGWSPGDDRELMSREDMIEAFSADRLLKSAAVFDPDKLAWFSAQYMFKSDLDVIIEHLRPFLAEVGLGVAPEDRLRELIEVHRLRAKTLKELAEQLVHYFQDGVEYDDALTKKFRKQPELPALLEELAAGFAALGDYTLEATEQVLRDLSEKRDVKAGYLIHPTRIALSGSKTGPGVFDVIVAVGQEEGERRMAAFVEYLKANPISPEDS